MCWPEGDTCGQFKLRERGATSDLGGGDPGKGGFHKGNPRKGGNKGWGENPGKIRNKRGL